MICLNGKMVEEEPVVDVVSKVESEKATNLAQKLAEGLSTATTIAQIRSAAKAILAETGGEIE